MRRLYMLGAVLLALVQVGPARAQAGPNDAAVQKAITYIRTQQAADGTFAGFGAGSTADAIYALAAANLNVAEFKNGGASAVEGLVKAAPEAAKDVGVAAKFVMAALLAGQEPRTLGGLNLVAVVENGFDATSELYGKDVTTHALSILALGAAGEPVRLAALAKLESLQLPDGGWSFDGAAATGSDTNTTGLAIQALISAKGNADVRGKALGYLRAQQNADAGFPYSQTSQFGNASDANSTAVSVQAILAAGETLSDWAKDGKTPIDRLLAFQNESGAFRYQDTPPDDNQLATYQAVPAILGKTFPVEGVAIALPDIEPVVPTPATGGTPVVTPVPTSLPTVPGAPTPAAGGPAQLPNTGTMAVPAMLALVAGLLILGGGLAFRRRSI